MVVPYVEMPPVVSTLPATVDHRDDSMEGPTRGQGSVPSCTAFATTSALDHAYALWTGKVEPLSVMQVWAEYHRPSQGAANAAIMGRSFAPETEWPYDAAEAQTWEPSDKCPKAPDKCGKSVDPSKLDQLGKKGILTVTQVERLWTRAKGTKKYDVPADIPIDVFRAKLAAGDDLVVGVSLPTHFKPIASKDGGDAMYISDDVQPRDKGGGHMMAITGYTVVADGTYFLLKNSWGPKWGENGYAWIHGTTLAKIAGGVFAIDAEPASTGGLMRVQARKGYVSACSGTQVPDTVTGTCSDLCSDGGPPTDAVCGGTEGCEAGEINLTGECVLAAPKKTGTAKDSGVGFDCAPGGCVYSIPTGFAGCRDHCQKSCPAPDFRLAKGSAGLTCIQ